MTNSITPDFASILTAVHGFLSLAEAELLYKLAAAVPPKGVIVEIGSYQGRSTVCLGLGAKQAGAGVWAIDPHEDVQVNEATHYGMENHAALLKNLVEFDVADVVRVVALEAGNVWEIWHQPVHLLWIDGNHDRRFVDDDLTWSYKMTPDSKIALHDSSGHYPGVTQALEEFLAEGAWHIIERVDATTVLRRA